MRLRKITFTLCLTLWGMATVAPARSFRLFAPEIKRDYPSVVYDFLERYLYEIDSLRSRRISVDQRLRDDRVVFLTGEAETARQITPRTAFEVNRIDEKYYDVAWRDSLGRTLLEVSFPMHYELLWGKPKAEIELDFRTEVAKYRDFTPRTTLLDAGQRQQDGCLGSQPISHYYVKTVNTASYFNPVDHRPTFSAQDKGHSAANLMQGCIWDVSRYKLYINQTLYGFRTVQYVIPLSQWLAYCQAMKLTLYFSVEEERADGIKALLVAQSHDLGFNHMLSLIIPDNFVEARSCVIKGTLNAYIPTQNVKELYQQYVDKPKKKIR